MTWLICDCVVCACLVLSGNVIYLGRWAGAGRFAGQLLVCPHFVVSHMSALFIGAGRRR